MIKEVTISKKLKEFFKEASNLINEGKLSEAESFLLKLHKKDPKNDIILVKLADIVWDMGNLDDAAKYFKIATVINPNFEAASLGLFHVLWELDRKEEALLEIKRFSQDSYCGDYLEIVEELSEHEYYNKIIKKIKFNIKNMKKE